MNVVKINAIWCSGCLVMNNIWQKVLKMYNIPTKELDYDFDNEEVLKYNPGNILPVFIFYKNNQEVKRIVGELSLDKMIKVIEEIGD